MKIKNFVTCCLIMLFGGMIFNSSLNYASAAEDFKAFATTVTNPDGSITRTNDDGSITTITTTADGSTITKTVSGSAVEVHTSSPVKTSVRAATEDEYINSENYKKYMKGVEKFQNATPVLKKVDNDEYEVSVPGMKDPFDNYNIVIKTLKGEINKDATSFYLSDFFNSKKPGIQTIDLKIKCKLNYEYKIYDEANKCFKVIGGPYYTKEIPFKLTKLIIPYKLYQDKKLQINKYWERSWGSHFFSNTFKRNYKSLKGIKYEFQYKPLKTGKWTSKNVKIKYKKNTAFIKVPENYTSGHFIFKESRMRILYKGYKSDWQTFDNSKKPQSGWAVTNKKIN